MSKLNTPTLVRQKISSKPTLLAAIISHKPSKAKVKKKIGTTRTAQHTIILYKARVLTMWNQRLLRKIMN